MRFAKWKPGPDDHICKLQKDSLTVKKKKSFVILATLGNALVIVTISINFLKLKMIPQHSGKNTEPKVKWSKF